MHTASRQTLIGMLLLTESVEATKAVGASLAPLLQGGDVLLLSGDLGAGKTAFVQGLAAGLGVTEPVTSPTFTLAAVYREGRLPLHHLDAYRLENLRETLDLDLPELLSDNAVLCIEWGEVVIPELPRDFLEIHLRLAPASPAPASPATASPAPASPAPANESANSRLLEFKFVGENWRQRTSEIAPACAAQATLLEAPQVAAS